MNTTLTKKWVRSKADEWAVDDGCYFDIKAADRVRYFFKLCLVHSKGQFAGQQFELLDWQWQDFIAPLFGWKRKNGTRRFRRAYVEISKKNGKSTICSGISLYLLIADNEPGAEVYSAASDRDQASIVYNEAKSMVFASVDLKPECYIRASKREIYFPATNSLYKALSADVPTKEGLNIHGLIFDEVHAQKNDKLFKTLRYGGAARRQPLIIEITTAGSDLKSMCYQHHTYAKRVASGAVRDMEFLPLIYGLEREEDWTDEKNWAKANPSLGITINVDDMRSAAQEAINNPVEQNSFRRYRLNQWLHEKEVWIPIHKWETSGKPDAKPPTDDSFVCFGGLDVSSVEDLTSFALWFPELCSCLVWHWTTEEALLRRQDRDVTKFDKWVKEGWIKCIEGATIDPEIVRKDINEIGEQYGLTDIAIDPWNSKHIAKQLLDDGYQVIFYRQGFPSMSDPTKQFYRYIISGTLQHYNNPVLRWQAENLAVEMDSGGNIKPHKGRSIDKIDGLVATIIAIGWSLAKGQEKSVYESRGIEYIPFGHGMDKKSNANHGD